MTKNHEASPLIQHEEQSDPNVSMTLNHIGPTMGGVVTPTHMNHLRLYNHYSDDNEDDGDKDKEVQHRQKRRQLLSVLWAEIWHQREEQI